MNGSFWFTAGLVTVAGVFVLLVAAGLYRRLLARQRRAAQAQPAAAGAAAPAAPAAGAPANPPRWGQRMRSVGAFALTTVVILVILSFFYGIGSLVVSTTERRDTSLPETPTPPSAIEIRGPFTPGPSDWAKRNVIRWWEVILPGNVPGWQPADPADPKGHIPIKVPWRKFAIRHQSGEIRTPHGSWPPDHSGWPTPTAESLLTHYPEATAQDLALPSGWLGEIVFRVVNKDGTSRGGNHLWNATVPPHNVAIAGGSKPGYFQFRINVPQPIVWEWKQPEDPTSARGSEWVMAPGRNVDRAHQEAMKEMLTGDLLRKAATPRFDGRFVAQNRGRVVFEATELNEYVPAGTTYPTSPE